MLDVDHLRQWVGESQTVTDHIGLATCQQMEATLDLEPHLGNGDDLPPLWHWLYFHEGARQSKLGRDGHAEKGGFLPPVSLPRRMWAGGRFEFLAPLSIGSIVEKKSAIKSVEVKSGRSGELCFVTVQHQLNCSDKLCIREEHDIVYREDPKPGDRSAPPPEAKAGPDFSQTITPTPVMLFRYSALTFNGHRIHYDIDYCRDVEAYPGLVFHGPLTATLLLQLAIKNAGGKKLKSFEFRAISPLFDVAPFELRGWSRSDQIELQAVNPDGGVAMRAVVGLE